MKTVPNVFISYSHSDKEFAITVANDLLKSGINVWIDKYDIRPGDSLIQKIFSEGLSHSDFFLILLSSTSVKSKWVAEELDAAMINKIQGVTKIIPLLKEQCDIPPHLRSLHWIDLSKNYEVGLREIVKAIYGVYEKPPIGRPPEYITNLKQSVGGLSKEASTLGFTLLSASEDETGNEKYYSPQELEGLLPSFSPIEINDAVDELESYGLVRAHKVFGNAPFYFGYITPTYALYLHFKDEGLNYDPEVDIKAVASAVAAKDKIEASELRSLVNLSPGRLNRAVSYLDSYGYVKVIKTLGTAPYDFREVWATRQTRQFVKENS